ncbi:Uncharacterised protein [uncultured archaeon]|nr:Uncharacterised protein [uncultured archaeon]
MESNENKSIRTQIEIVKSLLDGSNKSQRQIAYEINKEESTVSKALRYLEKAKVIAVAPHIIKSGNHNKGMYKNNICCLDYNLDGGVNILIFFKYVLKQKTLKQKDADDIVSTLQKNSRVVDLLANEFYKNLPKIKEYADEIKIFSYYLRGSQTFFKLVLSNSPDSLIDRFLTIYTITPEGIYRGIVEECIETDCKKTGVKKDELDKQKFFPEDETTIGDRKLLGLLKELNDSIFESCVRSDILAGIYNQSAIDYIRKKNEAAVRHREQWIESLKKSYYKFGQEYPDLPYIHTDVIEELDKEKAMENGWLHINSFFYPQKV